MEMGTFLYMSAGWLKTIFKDLLVESIIIYSL